MSDHSTLTGEKIVIFGWGAQGRAQSQNLKESGVGVSIYLRPSSEKIPEAKACGFTVITNAGEAAKSASMAALLIPDLEQGNFYSQMLEKNLPRNAAIIFAHGIAIHGQKIAPRKDLDILLAAPLGHASAVRSRFQEGSGVPFLIATAQNATGKAHDRALAYAQALSKMGPFIDTTFEEEVVSDLFTEQALLCGGLTELVRASFDTLVEAGINPEVSYFCCFKELKPMVDLMHIHGIAGMRRLTSDTARYGAVTRGPRVIGKEVRKSLKQIMEEITSGRFSGELSDTDAIESQMRRTKSEDEAHLIEKLHQKLGRCC